MAYDTFLCRTIAASDEGGHHSKKRGGELAFVLLVMSTQGEAGASYAPAARGHMASEFFRLNPQSCRQWRGKPRKRGFARKVSVKAGGRRLQQVILHGVKQCGAYAASP